MTWKLLLTFGLTTFTLNLIPGPAVMQVVGHSVSNGWLRAQASVFGILTGNFVYCAASALGLTAILLASHTVFNIIKYAGTAYLAWIALMLLMSKPSPVHQMREQHEAPAKLFVRSALLALSNPKSMLFFCAILPTFASDATSAPWTILLLGAVALGIEYCVLSTYCVGASVAGRSVHSLRFASATKYASGLMLLFAAIVVARTSI
ncbi:LysE family translocator [Burkholderia multivorans]|uniref:LysE family translocator n=1 Tax=Burkholderia multivorans TaxID=87883 RepID=UPI00209FAA9E|nr:LysE family translocator [Burkholderia multivorans]MCO8320331.1 LysE family translocator [Burkholderia multivorans]